MTSTAHVVLKEDPTDFDTLLPSDLKPNTVMSLKMASKVSLT